MVGCPTGFPAIARGGLLLVMYQARDIAFEGLLHSCNGLLRPSDLCAVSGQSIAERDGDFADFLDDRLDFVL